MTTTVLQSAILAMHAMSFVVAMTVVPGLHRDIPLIPVLNSIRLYYLRVILL